MFIVHVKTIINYDPFFKRTDTLGYYNTVIISSLSSNNKEIP